MFPDSGTIWGSPGVSPQIEWKTFQGKELEKTLQNPHGSQAKTGRRASLNPINAVKNRELGLPGKF